MNGQEIIEKLNEFLSSHNYKACVIPREELVQDEWDELETLLGKIKCVSDSRLFGEPSVIRYVNHFVDHDVYISLDGYYDSWNGTEWSDAEFREVKPEQRTYTVYVGV